MAAVREKPPVVQPGVGNNIIVNPNQVSLLTVHRDSTDGPLQRLNPILECIRNVGKEFGDIVPDFQVGRTTCILFLRYIASPSHLWCDNDGGQFEVPSTSSRVYPHPNREAWTLVQSQNTPYHVRRRKQVLYGLLATIYLVIRPSTRS